MALVTQAAASGAANWRVLRRISEGEPEDGAMDDPAAWAMKPPVLA